jgi:hypothetical protein
MSVFWGGHFLLTLQAKTGNILFYYIICQYKLHMDAQWWLVFAEKDENSLGLGGL